MEETHMHIYIMHTTFKKILLKRFLPRWVRVFYPSPLGAFYRIFVDYGRLPVLVIQTGVVFFLLKEVLVWDSIIIFIDYSNIYIINL